jgi:polysaccharide deacetylase family protein (PEP-CTERM system associated)
MVSDYLLTVDVEDYFHVEAFADVVSRASWGQYTPRVEANTTRLLDLFDEFHAKATFFILGWVAERFPGLVREIVKRGHEPACHSYWHRLIYCITPQEFRDDTRRAKAAIEDAAGVGVRGYRAPSYSVTSKSLWALDALAEAGFAYDSSIFPIRHDIYGMPDAPRFPFRIQTSSGEIVEYPITTFRVLSNNLPVGGGGYFRMLPFWYTQWGLGRAAKEGVPRIIYIHPWEIDPEQPRLGGRARSRLRHYTNLDKTYARLRRLLSQGRFRGFENGEGLEVDRATKFPQVAGL